MISNFNSEHKPISSNLKVGSFINPLAQTRVDPQRGSWSETDSTHAPPTACRQPQANGGPLFEKEGETRRKALITNNNHPFRAHQPDRRLSRFSHAITKSAVSLRHKAMYFMIPTMPSISLGAVLNSEDSGGYVAL